MGKFTEASRIGRDCVSGGFTVTTSDHRSMCHLFTFLLLCMSVIRGSVVHAALICNNNSRKVYTSINDHVCSNKYDVGNTTAVHIKNRHCSTTFYCDTKQ